MTQPASLRSLVPHRNQRPDSKQRSRQRRRKDGKDGQPHAKKRPYHRHQFDISESHPLHAAGAQVNGSGTVNKGSTHCGSSQRIEQ
jgi:hypothetical protein